MGMCSDESVTFGGTGTKKWVVLMNERGEEENRLIDLLASSQVKTRLRNLGSIVFKSC